MQLIKIGGGASINIKAILRGVKENFINTNGEVILVHGGNATRAELGQRLGQEIKRIQSASGASSVRSDRDLVELMMLSYAGLQNKRIVEQAQQLGINALGLTGLDGALIRGKRKAVIKARFGEKIKIIRDDYSGQATELNTELIKILLKMKIVPLITPPILSEENEALNTENDGIIALISRSLPIKRIIHFIEAPGLLENKDDENSLRQSLNLNQIAQAIQSTQGGMQRKMMGVQDVLKQGINEVIFADGRHTEPFKQIKQGLCTRFTQK